MVSRSFDKGVAMLPRLLFAALLLTSALELRAQLSELQIDPNPASTLETVDVLVAFPWFASSQTFDVQTEVSGTLITLDIEVEGQPSGPPLFFLHLETVGPLAPGEYTVVANYRVDNVLEDSETAVLRVEAVRAVPLLDKPLVLGLLTLLLLASPLFVRRRSRQ